MMYCPKCHGRTKVYCTDKPKRTGGVKRWRRCLNPRCTFHFITNELWSRNQRDRSRERKARSEKLLLTVQEESGIKGNIGPLYGPNRGTP